MLGIMKQKMKKFVKSLFPEFFYSKQTFSQEGEDVVLSSFYETEDVSYQGFYIDVGAHHPYRYSNTAYFYKKSWKGINIEATSSLIAAFHRDRKRDINLNVGIANEDSILTFYEFEEAALNSFNKKISFHLDKNTKHKIISKKILPVYKLATILNKHLPKNQKIDFFNIDVEGLDLCVLQSNNWNKYKPKFILVEGKLDIEQFEKNKTYVFLMQKGYKLIAKTRRTLIFGQN